MPGVSAGIDLALEVVAKLSGPDVAQSTQLLVEYDRQPPFDTGAPSKALERIKDMLGGLVASSR